MRSLQIASACGMVTAAKNAENEKKESVFVMKKAVRLCALLLALALLSGCGSPPAPAEPDPTPPPEAAGTPVPEPAPAPTPEPTPTPVPTPVPEDFPFDFSQTLADTEELGLDVIALGLDANGDWVFHLYMENRAAEILSLRFLYQSINGIAVETFKYRLAVGEAREQEFRVFHEALESFGSSAPVEWAFTLRVTSAEYNRKPFILEPLRVCPFGEDLAERYVYTPAEGDTVLMDNDLITIYATGYSQEADSFALEYVAVSKIDAPLRLTLSGDPACTVNGLAAEAALNDELGGRATLIGYLPISGDFLETEQNVESLRFVLQLDDPLDPENRRLDRRARVDLAPDYPLD